jgi:hypothetical protein
MYPHLGQDASSWSLLKHAGQAQSLHSLLSHWCHSFSGREPSLGSRRMSNFYHLDHQALQTIHWTSSSAEQYCEAFGLVRSSAPCFRHVLMALVRFWSSFARCFVTVVSVVSSSSVDKVPTAALLSVSSSAVAPTFVSSWAEATGDVTCFISDFLSAVTSGAEAAWRQEVRLFSLSLSLSPLLSSLCLSSLLSSIFS